VRVNEVFNHCADLQHPDEAGCLIYITKLTNFKDGLMGTSPYKHIGIYLKQEVWHYSNSHHKVERLAKHDWISRVDSYYGGHTVTKYTVIPDSATFLTLTQLHDLAK
jgi:hypothetical protein